MFLILCELRKNRSEEGLQREIHEVIKTIVQRSVGKRNRKGRKMCAGAGPGWPNVQGGGSLCQLALLRTVPTLVLEEEPTLVSCYILTAKPAGSRD